MAFQAPESDSEPTGAAAGGFKAPDDDIDPPKTLEGFLGNAVSNFGRAINPINIGKGLAMTAKEGLYDVPKAAAESSVDLLKGTAKALAGEGLPTQDDIESSPIIEHTRQMTEPIAKDPVGFAYKNPVDAAMLLATPVMGLMGGEAAGSAAARNVSRGTMADAAAAAEEAPKGLPVIPPGAKTGDPHALFAYNDKFGPGGSERSIYNIFGDPEHAAIKARGWGSSIPAEDLEASGIPIKGREPKSVNFEPIETKPPLVPMGGEGPEPQPASRMPPDPNAPPPPPKPEPTDADPFKDVRDYVASKGAKIEQQGGWPERVAKYLKNEATDLGAKDIGLQGRQIQSMGQGFKGLEKAEALVNYAREKGYLDPGLTDVARKEKIMNVTKTTGDHLDAIRNVADKRGAPPIEAIRQAVQQELEAKYGAGTEKATSEIANVMDDVNKAKPTFSGMSELATKLNHSATKVKDLGQHPGPTTDAANIVSRINNDALRGVLNPQESELYTQSLRDYGAHKKLEQAVAGAGRRSMSARSNQRGIFGRVWQEALDRGGYRIGGNVANKVADTILKNPGKIKTLPQFFEELAHTSDDTLDEALGIGGMYQGGAVPDDVRQYVQSRTS